MKHGYIIDLKTGDKLSYDIYDDGKIVKKTWGKADSPSDLIKVQTDPSRAYPYAPYAVDQSMEIQDTGGRVVDVDLQALRIEELEKEKAQLCQVLDHATEDTDVHAVRHRIGRLQIETEMRKTLSRPNFGHIIAHPHRPMER